MYVCMYVVNNIGLEMNWNDRAGKNGSRTDGKPRGYLVEAPADLSIPLFSGPWRSSALKVWMGVFCIACKLLLRCRPPVMLRHDSCSRRFWLAVISAARAAVLASVSRPHAGLVSPG